MYLPFDLAIKLWEWTENKKNWRLLAKIYFRLRTALNLKVQILALNVV